MAGTMKSKLGMCILVVIFRLLEDTECQPMQFYPVSYDYRSEDNLESPFNGFVVNENPPLAFQGRSYVELDRHLVPVPPNGAGIYDDPTLYPQSRLARVIDQFPIDGDNSYSFFVPVRYEDGPRVPISWLQPPTKAASPSVNVDSPKKPIYWLQPVAANDIETTAAKKTSTQRTIKNTWLHRDSPVLINGSGIAGQSKDESRSELNVNHLVPRIDSAAKNKTSRSVRTTESADRVGSMGHAEQVLKSTTAIKPTESTIILSDSARFDRALSDIEEMIESLQAEERDLSLELALAEMNELLESLRDEERDLSIIHSMMAEELQSSSDSAVVGLITVSASPSTTTEVYDRSSINPEVDVVIENINSTLESGLNLTEIRTTIASLDDSTQTNSVSTPSPTTTSPNTITDSSPTLESRPEPSSEDAVLAAETTATEWSLLGRTLSFQTESKGTNSTHNVDEVDCQEYIFDVTSKSSSASPVPSSSTRPETVSTNETDDARKLNFDSGSGEGLTEITFDKLTTDTTIDERSSTSGGL